MLAGMPAHAPVSRKLLSSGTAVRVRSALLRLGGRANSRQLAYLRSVLSYLELGRWLADEQQRPAQVARDTDLFAMAAARVTGERPLYLEFGVFEGRSMRWWAEHLTPPGARLVGFDSFDGLPEDWRPDTPRGHFRTAGPPQIDDPRVSFEVGWFDQTLPNFKPPEHDQLIVNVDCDLYTSAVTVLDWLEPHIVPGTLVYFDEFPDRDHEMRALFESLSRTGRQVRPLGMARGGVHWLLQYY